MKPTALLACTLLACTQMAATATAAPVRYDIDPAHTYPSFEADHMGMSMWRGKLTRSSGLITYDKADGSGTVEVTMDLASIDFGLDAMNAWARGKSFFDLGAQSPQAVFKGRFEDAVAGVPRRVAGELTLNGRTRPVTLAIHQLKCMPHPLSKRDWCGADASGSFNREDFGLSAGKDYGFKMEVGLRIQVEAVAAP